MTRRVDLRDDRGASLLEVVVTMALLSIFMGLFTVSTLMMTRTTVRVQNMAESSQQSNGGFLALERAVRYSTGITQPRRDGAVWNVEFAWQDKNAGSTANRCTQLRVANDSLQQRSWQVDSNGVNVDVTPSRWRTLATGVTNGATSETDEDRPFRDPVAAGSSASRQNQGLTLTVLTSRGTGQTVSTRRSSTTFTAMNTSASPTWTDTVCQHFGVNS